MNDVPPLSKQSLPVSPKPPLPETQKPPLPHLTGERHAAREKKKTLIGALGYLLGGCYFTYATYDGVTGSSGLTMVGAIVTSIIAVAYFICLANHIKWWIRQRKENTRE